MKTINRNSLLIAAFCAVAVSFSAAAYAEKGAETLVRLTKGAVPAKSEVASMTHECLNCTDTLVSVVDMGTKGPNHAVTKVVKHNCTGCSTKIATEGTGKAKHDVVIHICGADAKATCCAKN